MTFGNGQVSRSVEVSTNSCLTDWLAGTGVPMSKLDFYEEKLRDVRVQIGKIGHYSPLILQLTGITVERSLLP